jgi:hypothetical protein
MKKSVWATVVVLSLLCGLCVPSAFSQAVYGSILGTVTDPSGAAVNGAKVTVTSQTKNVSFDATTNESGNYSVTHLIPDTYSIKVEGSGFKVLEFRDIVVSADAAKRVDGQFQLGSTSEQVEVTAEAPALKTDRADVSTEFDSRYVADMPILNRNFTQLQLMAPGSQKLTGWSHAATENPQGSQQIFTQGQHFSGTAFELDGTDNQDPILGIIVVNPNLDAVTEAKVALQNYDAEFGKAVSSVVTAQTKSGSNEIHGSGFWFRRTDAEQARNPFTQSTANPLTHRFIPSSRWQQFGGTVGGPILKNKLFFFGDYQATRQALGVSGLFNMPTTLVQQTCNPATNTTGYCDLSEYLSSEVPGGGQIYDPLPPSQGGISAGATPGVGQGGVRSPFPDNHIPINRISPAAGKVLAALPAVPSSVGILNNFQGSGAGPFSQNSFDTRIDFAASPTVNVFGRFSLDYFKLSGKGVFGALQGPGDGGGASAPGLAGSSITHNYSLATGVTKAFSSSLLADFRFGYFKYNPQTSKPDGGTPMTAFGIPGANTSDPKTAGLGEFILGPDQISGGGSATANSGQGLFISTFGDGLGVARCNCPLTESEQQFQFVGNVTKTKGNHIFKFGADIRYAMNLRIPSDNNRTGEFNFSPEATSSGNTGSGGLDLGTFLLGEVTSFARYVNNPNLPSANNAAERQKRWFFYGQDTWRFTSKLTLSYGLRWEIYFPESVNAKGNGGFANIIDNNGQGGIRVAGYGPYGTNGNISNDLHAFAPRLGIAYQVAPKTVVRMGYGRSYDIGVFGSNFGHTVTQNLPVLLKQNYDATTYTTTGAAGGYNPIVDQNGNPFMLDVGPTGPGISPATAFGPVPSNGFIPLTAQLSGTHLRPVRQTLPTIDAWNATVQHQLTNSMALEVAYVGSKGTHGFAGDGPNYDVNPVDLANFDAVNPITTTNPLKPVLFTQSERRPLCGPEITTPGPNLGACSRIGFDLGNYYGNDAASTYNAFEVKVDKRFSQGLEFVSHYTFSHADNFTDSYYAIDHRIAWGPVDFSRNHVWIFSPIYQLPFGKGKPFLGNANSALDYLVGGWQVSDTTNWSSGLPWTPSFNECGAEQDVGQCRPSKGAGSFPMGVSGGISAAHQLTYYTPVPDIVTTPGVFTDPGFGHIGNIGRNVFHGPSGFYSDLSVVKKFRIYERLNAQFRMDAFNIFNHPVYAFSGNNGAQTCIDCAPASTGKISNIEDGTTMRELQFALRFDF